MQETKDVKDFIKKRISADHSLRSFYANKESFNTQSVSDIETIIDSLSEEGTREIQEKLYAMDKVPTIDDLKQNELSTIFYFHKSKKTHFYCVSGSKGYFSI